MCKRVSLVFVAVLVSASCSALPIPTVSKVSKYVNPVRDEAEGQRKQMLRINGKETDFSHDERTRPFLPTSKGWSATELLEAGAPKPNQWNNGLTHNHAVANVHAYALDVKTIEESMQKLRELLDTSKIHNDKLILMAVGNEYFKSLGPDRSYISPLGYIIFESKMDPQLFDTWNKLFHYYGYKSNTVFEKMRILESNIENPSVGTRDYAYMAMGSEFLSGESRRPRGIPVLPSSTNHPEHVNQQGGVPVPSSSNDLLELVSSQRGVELSKSKEWMERLKTDPTYKYKSYEDLVWDATGRAMGDDLTLA